MTARYTVSLDRYGGRIYGLPDDGRVVLFSTSERADWICPRRGWFRHVERLRHKATEDQRLGTLWHRLMEEVHRWFADYDTDWPDAGETVCPWCAGVGSHRHLIPPSWSPPAAPDGAQVTLADLFTAPAPVAEAVPEYRTEPCQRCHGRGLGVLERIRQRLLAEVEDVWNRGRAGLTQESAETILLTLERALAGWFVMRGGRAPLERWRVVGVEVKVARVIHNPTTDVAGEYRPDTYVVRTDTGLRLAGTGEATQAREDVDVVRWPWALVGTLDAVFVDRETGRARVGEWKMGSDPDGKFEGLDQDPQVAGYCWLLDGPGGTELGLSAGVDGYIYQATGSSLQRVPATLKSKPTKKDPNPRPELSRAAATTPSWMYAEEVLRLGLDLGEYAEHIAGLRVKVDQRLYPENLVCDITPSQLERFGREVFATAVRIAGHRRAAARLSGEVDKDVDFPRVAICRLPGGSCGFKTPCANDTPENRQWLEVGEHASWVSTGVNTGDGLFPRRL